MPRYGGSTRARSRSWLARSSSGDMMTFDASEVSDGRMSSAPSSTPMFAPTGLNAWARLSRCVAEFSGPIAMTNGLAEVSRIDKPAASTKRASRKNS
jgi:hypothetical protein